MNNNGIAALFHNRYFFNCVYAHDGPRVTFSVIITDDDDMGFPWEDFAEVFESDFSETETVTISGIAGLSNTFWNSFCEWLPVTFPSIRKVCIDKVYNIVDERMMQILKSVPENVHDLALSGIAEDLPLTFEYIGQMGSLSKVKVEAPEDVLGNDETLSLTGGGCTILAEALEKLPLLTEVFIGNIWMHNPNACWVPLAQAIRRSPKLEHIHVESGWEIFKTRQENDQFAKPFTLAGDILESLKFRPLMRKMEQKYGLGENANPSTDPAVVIKKLAKAIDFAGGRLDIIHTLVSNVDPSLLALTLARMEKSHKVRKQRTKKSKTATKTATKLSWKVFKKYKCRSGCLLCGPSE